MPPKRTKAATSSLSSTAVDVELSHQQQVETLVRKRSSLKSKLSRLSNYFHRVKDDNPNSATIVEIKSRLKDIESHVLSEFSNVQFELQGLDPNSFSEDELDDFESTYFKVISEIKQFLSTEVEVVATDGHSPALTGEGLTQFMPDMHSTKRPSAKLPIIELPKFSGQFEKWLEFRDLYVSLVHKSLHLDPIEKFQYLKASLEGPASHCIQAITICSENYQLAWDILCQRFENKRLIVHNHIKSLFNIIE